MSTRQIAAIAIIIGLLSAPAAADETEGEFKKYDFTKPEEVFKATLSETVVGSGVSPEILYQTLQAGQIVIVNDKPNNPDIPWLTTAGILINAPPETVFAVIEDIESYPGFMPQTENAYRKPVTDEVDHVFYELAIQILFVKVKVPYSVYHWNRPPNRVDWVMAGGDFINNLGAYEVVAVPGEPNRSMLLYTSYSLPRNDVVESLFDKVPNLDMMINLSAGTLVVEAMKKRSEEMFKKKGGDPSPPSNKPDIFKIYNEHPEAIAQLAKRGRMVVLDDTNPPYYTGAIVADAPPEKAMESVRDFEGLASISKNNEMTILKMVGDSARVKIRTDINLVIDFDSTYIVNYDFSEPNRFTWKGEPGGDLEGIAGSWEFKQLGPEKTLVLYRNTSDIKSHGMAMRQLLKIEPSFEMAIQASQTLMMMEHTKDWIEASPAERKKMARDPR